MEGRKRAHPWMVTDNVPLADSIMLVKLVKKILVKAQRFQFVIIWDVRHLFFAASSPDQSCSTRRRVPTEEDRRRRCARRAGECRFGAAPRDKAEVRGRAWSTPVTPHAFGAKGGWSGRRGDLTPDRASAEGPPRPPSTRVTYRPAGT